MENRDNVLSYIRLRGDFTFKEDPFNEVDALIFTLVSYFDFNHIVDNDNTKISIQDVCNEIIYLEESKEEYLQKKMSDNEYDIEDHKDSFSYERELLKEMALSSRFKDITFSHFIDESSYDKVKQFCALHIHFNNNTFISFRGTDDTLVGWKENWQMLYKSPVEGQKRACQYVNETINTSLLSMFHNYYIGGHSKGGNLAVYAMLHCDSKLLKKVKGIYNFDGPGFLKPFEDSERYLKIKHKLKSYTPKFSVICMSLEHYLKDKTVESFYEGLNQHDGYSWIVKGNHFVEAKRDEESKVIENTFRSWVSSIPKEEREEFVNALFEVLEKANIQTLSQFLNLNALSIATIAKSLIDLDSKKRNLMINILMLLIKENRQVKKELNKT